MASLMNLLGSLSDNPPPSSNHYGQHETMQARCSCDVFKENSSRVLLLHSFIIDARLKNVILFPSKGDPSGSMPTEKSLAKCNLKKEEEEKKDKWPFSGPERNHEPYLFSSFMFEEEQEEKVEEDEEDDDDDDDDDDDEKKEEE
uniref:Uncharacterized protein n=1 Tax=Vespula pensylvanica TaxID=30213 RepID=A0A834P104_VESPE|nr:hypothetical protein H0235_009034 [Vespula pensylvanica]